MKKSSSALASEKRESDSSFSEENLSEEDEFSVKDVEVFKQEVIQDHPDFKYKLMLEDAYLAAPSYVNKFLLSKQVHESRLKEPIKDIVAITPGSKKQSGLTKKSFASRR